MSPRIKRLRKVLNLPLIKGFKPYGLQAERTNTEAVTLLYEEYEAIRLCDYDMYNHHQASMIMGVSRPTFTRIYASARQKIAKSFVEGKQMTFEGGKVYFDSDWYQCEGCHCYFNNPEKEQEVTNCPLCGNPEITTFESAHDIVCNRPERCDDLCVCPICGFEKLHGYGEPCRNQICPKCHIQMTRKGTPHSKIF